MNTNFKFNIYDGIEKEQGVDRISNPNDGRFQELLTSPVGSSNERQFIPRTPDSMRIKNGERSALINKMVTALRAQVQETQNNTNQTGDVVSSEDKNTDLQNIDADIRSILNSFGIFFFSQIPSHIITVYGSLLSNNGKDESFQRIIESDLSNEEYFSLYAYQKPLRSQERIK